MSASASWPPPSSAIEPSQRLSGVDTAWLRMDDPTNLMTIHGVLVLEGPVERERLRQVVAERLLPIGRFRQRVGRDGRRPRWEPDPDFDLDRHLTFGRLPEPAGDAELRRLVGERMSQPLDLHRPLWHFDLIENYRGGAALLGRLHHCIGDGLALMMVLLSLTDLAPDAPAGEVPAGAPAAASNPFCGLFRRGEAAFETAWSAVERLMPEGAKLLSKPAEMLRRTSPLVRGLAAAGTFGKMTFRTADPRTVFKGSLGVAKRAAWSESIPVEAVSELRQSLGGTVNDLLLTAVAGGLRRYMVARGERPDGVNFRATVPVSLRPVDEMHALGNRFGLVFLSLPVGIADPRARLAELRRRMEALKRSTESFVVLKVLAVLGHVPLPLQRLVVDIFGSKATAVVTNVPGPRETLYLAGRPLRDLFFWVPQSGRLGMGISILSYAGRVRVGVATDAGLVPDPERIVAGFHEELAAMRDLATAPGSHSA